MKRFDFLHICDRIAYVRFEGIIVELQRCRKDDELYYCIFNFNGAAD